MSISRQRKAEKRVGVRQLELRGIFDKLIDQGKTRSRPNWYYLTKLQNEYMLMSSPDALPPIWVQHDLRVAKPYLYRTIHLAQKARSQHRSAAVKLYPHLV